MEDPWSTPWAVDTPSASPGLTPTKPKTGAGAGAGATTLPGTGTITPTEHGAGLGAGLGMSGFEDSPWGGATMTNGFDAAPNGFDSRRDTPQRNGTQADDDDAWGGWDDGKHDNAWVSSGGDALTQEPTSNVSFSAPWGDFEQEKKREEEGGTADSAVSFGEHQQQQQRPKEEDVKPIPVVTVEDETRRNAITLLEDEQGAWTAPAEEAVAPSAAAMGKTEETTNVPEARMDEIKQTVDDESFGQVGDNIESAADKDKEQPSTAQDATATAAARAADELAEQQKASKVQELVDMYDGIAKKAVRPPPPDTIPREATAKRSAEASREDVSLQELDAEEVMASGVEVVESPDDEDHSTAQVEVASPTKDDESSEEAPESDAEPDESRPDLAGVAQQPNLDEEATPHSLDEEPHSLDEEQPPPDSPKSGNKPPPYPIDLSNLDALFPGSKASTTRPEPVPDVIIDNSYTTTSERKTWYRISRFGSSRKHDSGDEDNYKRVAWADSQVHDKTLRIVRRWMEQDSIAGRVVLGSRKAGPLGASMFNWDSSEPQIEISELLRQRVQSGTGSGGGHTRNKSLPQADAPPQTPTLESFGEWSSNASMPSTPSAVVQSSAFAAQIKGKTGSALRPPESPAEMPKSPWEDDQGRDEERKKSTEIMPPPPAPAAANTAVEDKEESIKAESSSTEEDEDNDDDWGEMVSSPTIDSSSTFGSLSAPADIKPTPLHQSLEADFSGLDFFESAAPKPTPAVMERPNPPPPIRTAGLAIQSKAAAPSPIWTPTMNSPALEPMRVSTDHARKSPAGTPALASTPVLEAARVTTSSHRPSIENAWTASVPAPPTNTQSMEDIWSPSASQPTTNNKSSMESAWTHTAATPMTAPAAKPTKQPSSKRVSFEDTRKVDKTVIIEEALRSLPDLSYMLR
ncbi:hypothetical protein PWT90_05736 [Aphanocladium album]|nr:hypothetical protein PWT90_05736 [Aphanocladium album]